MGERRAIVLLVLGGVLVVSAFGPFSAAAVPAGGRAAGGLFLLCAGWLLVLFGARVDAGAESLRTATASGPAVRLTGHLDAPLSRGLWLVKWLLAIPHAVILFFLGAAFAVLTISAFVAILFTGRYPPPLFAAAVGIVRWGWRVGFYAYSALGTDRYPPFTLRDVPYPARLEIDYPERLSRGLVLVKWWLLAIPHYLIVSVLAGAPHQNGLTLVPLLVLIAAVALLFTDRYPPGLFDLVVGVHRWVARVLAYAFLMSDDYPPFRLDLGAEEPARG